MKKSNRITGFWPRSLWPWTQFTTIKISTFIWLYSVQFQKDQFTFSFDRQENACFWSLFPTQFKVTAPKLIFAMLLYPLPMKFGGWGYRLHLVCSEYFLSSLGHCYETVGCIITTWICAYCQELMLEQKLYKWCFSARFGLKCHQLLPNDLQDC